MLTVMLSLGTKTSAVRKDLTKNNREEWKNGTWPFGIWLHCREKAGMLIIGSGTSLSFSSQEIDFIHCRI